MTIREQLQALGIDHGPNCIDQDVRRLITLFECAKPFAPLDTKTYTDQYFIHTGHWRKQCYGTLTWDDLCPCVKCYSTRAYAK